MKNINVEEIKVIYRNFITVNTEDNNGPPCGMLVRGADELGLVPASGLQWGALVGLPVLNIIIRTEDDINYCE